jgi:hypothetical protein
MKKLLRRLSLLLFLTALIPSCDLLEDCKTCHTETWENGTMTSSTTGILTCGDQLSQRESEDPVTVGDKTTYWVCE